MKKELDGQSLKQSENEVEEGAGEHIGLSWFAETVSVYVCCPLHSQKCPSLDDKLCCYLIFRPVKELRLILNEMGSLLEGSE